MLKEHKPITIEQQKSDKIEKIFKGLSTIEQKDIEAYMDYRKARGLNDVSKTKTTRADIIHLRYTAQKDLSKLDIKELTKLASLIKKSVYGQYAKNETLTNLKRYIKWKNPNLNVDDIMLIKEPTSKIIIKNGDLPTKADVEKLIRHEPKMFWKAFLIVQYEAGLRTKEVRYLKWSDIEFNSEGDLSELNIFATKTKKQRQVFIKEGTFYLQKLKEEQENLKEIGTYVFHSKGDLNKPVSRANISLWMTRLSQKALGRSIHPYLLRHSRGNELYQLSKKGKISKDIALSFMGHSSEMSKVYTHDKSEEIKQMLKEQIYHLEDYPEEKKAEIMKRVENIEHRLKRIEKMKEAENK